jgi:hypothetical protein
LAPAAAALCAAMTVTYWITVVGTCNPALADGCDNYQATLGTSIATISAFGLTISSVMGALLAFCGRNTEIR